MSEQKFFIEYSGIGEGVSVDNIDDLFDVIRGKIDLLDNEENITVFCEAFRYFIQEYPEDLEYSEDKLKEIFKGKSELRNKINKKIEEMGGIEGFEGIEEMEEMEETEEFEEIKRPERINKLNEMQNDFLKFEEFEKILEEKNEVPTIFKLFKMCDNYYQGKYGKEINDKFSFFSFTINFDKGLLREGIINTIGSRVYCEVFKNKGESEIGQTVGAAMDGDGRTVENFSYRSNFVFKKVYRNLISKIFEKAKEIITEEQDCSIEDALERSMIKVKKELTEENEKGKDADFYINSINELREKINSIDGTRKVGTLSNAFSRSVKINFEELDKLPLKIMREYHSEDEIKTKDESDALEKRIIEIEEKCTALKKRIEIEDKFKIYYRRNKIEKIKNLFDSNKDYLDKKCLSEITTGSPEYKPLIIDALEKDNIEIANLLIINGINCGNNVELIKIKNKENFIENLGKVIDFEPKINIGDDKINDLFNDNGEIDVKNKLNPLMNEIVLEKTLMMDGNDIVSDLNTSFNLNTSRGLGNGK